MPTKDDLDAAQAAESAALTKLGTDLKQALKDLEDKIASAPAPMPVDLTAEIAHANAIAQGITDLDTSATAADPGAPKTP